MILVRLQVNNKLNNDITGQAKPQYLDRRKLGGEMPPLTYLLPSLASQTLFPCKTHAEDARLAHVLQGKRSGL